MENNTLCHDAVVKKIEDEHIIVRMEVESACAACHSKHLCGMTESKQEELIVENPDHEIFEIGERVKVEIRHSLAWKAILVCYLFPFLVLFVSFIILSITLENELQSALLALGATAAYYFVVWLFRNKIDQNTHFIIRKKTQL